MAFRNFIDGTKSFGAAILTAAVCGIPTWFTVQAVLWEIAPVWAYAAAGLLGLIGLILTFAFLRKGFEGVSPSRQRRR